MYVTFEFIFLIFVSDLDFHNPIVSILARGISSNTERTSVSSSVISFAFLYPASVSISECSSKHIGEKPNTLNGEKPNTLNGENPNTANGENPNTANGENPNTWNGEKPNTPNGTNENVVVISFDSAEYSEFPLALVAYTLYRCAVPGSCASAAEVVVAVSPDLPSFV